MNYKTAWCAAALLAAGAAIASASEVPTRADQVRPLLIGAQAPEATVQSLDGTDVALQDIFAKQRTVLVFYRGGW